MALPFSIPNKVVKHGTTDDTRKGKVGNRQLKKFNHSEQSRPPVPGVTFGRVKRSTADLPAMLRTALQAGDTRRGKVGRLRLRND